MSRNPRGRAINRSKAQIKREKTSLGWAYCIYINGMYMGTGTWGTGLTKESAHEAVPRMPGHL